MACISWMIAWSQLWSSDDWWLQDTGVQTVAVRVSVIAGTALFPMAWLHTTTKTRPSACWLVPSTSEHLSESYFLNFSRCSNLGTASTPSVFWCCWLGEGKSVRRKIPLSKVLIWGAGLLWCSEWVSGCLTAHQHNTGYSVPLMVEWWNDLYAVT